MRMNESLGHRHACIMQDYWKRYGKVIRFRAHVHLMVGSKSKRKNLYGSDRQIIVRPYMTGGT